MYHVFAHWTIVSKPQITQDKISHIYALHKARIGTKAI